MSPQETAEAVNRRYGSPEPATPPRLIYDRVHLIEKRERLMREVREIDEILGQPEKRLDVAGYVG